MYRAALGFALAGLCAQPAGAHPEIEEALTRLNQRLAAAPTDADAFVERGELYAKHAEWISAEANFLRAVELAPQHPRLARARGALELATGNPAEALRLLNESLARTPRDASALVLRARAHAALKSPDRAGADLDAALAMTEAPAPELFLERAALLPAPRAIESLDAALARLGPVIALELRAVTLEESLGRIEAASARLDAIATRSERPESWLKRRGDLLARAGRTADAQRIYSAALAAIAKLPAWLRASPDTVQLAKDLEQLTITSS